MKLLAAFTEDGFKASIELLRFSRDMNNDLLESIVSIVGTSTVFIKGGVISELAGNTTITNGIILKDAKLYHFTGGTYAGTPAVLKVLFEEQTASGFPRPYYENDPVAKDIYLERTARIDATGAVFLNSVGSTYNLQSLKTKIDTLNASVDVLNEKTYLLIPIIGIGSGSDGYIHIRKSGKVVTIYGHYNQGITATTAGFNLISSSSMSILAGFPLDSRGLSCYCNTSINGSLIAINPSVKQIAIVIGSGSLLIQLQSTMAVGSTVQFEATFINTN